ncbi:MAG: arginyltransferase [Deltaproteobacteria bacterium]|nr:MAG: arginyltransferase [Deltaproteobacteria bacterium]
MSLSPRLRLVAAEPPELIVYDEPGPCSYLTDQIWRLPLRLPLRMLTRAEYGRRLATGDRRQGRLLYRTACPACRACEPIRLDVERFAPGRTQRRVERRGDETFLVELGPLEASDERVTLYNLHKQARDLSVDEETTDADAFQSFLGDSCCESFEIRYSIAGELGGIAIVDRTDDALSAVYFYWHPKLAPLSPGTYSILKQVDLCKRWGLRYLYLGLHIADCRPMVYKARFLPHERLIAGRWRHFERK